MKHGTHGLRTSGGPRPRRRRRAARAAACGLCCLFGLHAPGAASAHEPDAQRPSSWPEEQDAANDDDALALADGDAAASAASSSAAAGSVAQRLEPDDDGGKEGFVVLPGVVYAPETSVVFAVAGMYYIPTHDAGGNTRVSQLGAIVAYTLNNQLITELRPNLWLGGGDYHVRGEYRYSYYPDSFHGLGNDTRPDNGEAYSTHIARARTFFERRVTDQLYFGALYELEHHEIVQRASDGRLAGDSVPGAEGGLMSGVGLMATYDGRDNTMTTHEGNYAQVTFSVFDEAVGSDHDFTRTQLDLRRFSPLWLGHTLALRAYLEIQTGRPPFQFMPKVGGSRFGRGYFNGRFLDRNLLSFQAEYRLPLFWRVGAVAFGSVSQVAYDLDALTPQRFHPAGGAGLRYVVDDDAGAIVRFDVGFGEDSKGIYFNVGEAF